MSSLGCSVPGCDQPRYKSGRRVYARCLEHMRPIWRENARQKGKKIAPPQSPDETSGLEKFCSTLRAESAAWIEHVKAGPDTNDLLQSLRYADQQRLRLEEQVETLTAALQQVTAERDRACQKIADLRQRQFAAPARHGNTPPDAKIFASSFGANYGLLILEGRIVSRLPMPDTERERLDLVQTYAAQGYWIAEAQ